VDKEERARQRIALFRGREDVYARKILMAGTDIYRRS
jgi:hypothetical protein